MKINLLTGKSGPESLNPISIDERDFWRHYLHFLQLRSEFYLAPKEMMIMSWVLSKDPDVSYFSKPHSDQMTEVSNKLSGPELTRIKQSLIAYGLLEEFDDPNDGRKKLVHPVSPLRKFQRYIKASKQPIKIVFAYEISEDEASHDSGDSE